MIKFLFFINIIKKELVNKYILTSFEDLKGVFHRLRLTSDYIIVKYTFDLNKKDS